MQRITALGRLRRTIAGRPWSESRLQEARVKALETCYRAGLFR